MYFGPHAQWRRLRREGLISDVQCYTESAKALERNYVFNKKGAVINHKFCFARPAAIACRGASDFGAGVGACNKSRVEVPE